MAIHVSNMKELNKALQPVLLKMVDQLADRVYETLNYFLQDYRGYRKAEKAVFFKTYMVYFY